MNRPVAYFKYVDIFTVTSRGVVIAGHIIDGEINAGDRIELNVQGTVKSLAVISSDSEN